MDIRSLRLRVGRQWGCSSGSSNIYKASKGSRLLVPRYQVADRTSECSQLGNEDACSISSGSRQTSPLHGSNGGDVATRLALERLYLSPLDWSRGFFLVTTDGEPSAGDLALATQQQQQQQRTPPDQREKSPDYYANVGDAIRTLREDIPLLFERELNFSIYRDDIVFRDPRNSFQGLANYKTIFWSLRFHGRIFFKKLYVDVKRIWQTEDSTIRMRWTVHGVPRVPWEAEGTFDGISQYKLDNEGKIYEHAVDNVILRDPPVGVVPWLYGINLVPQQQQAVPGAFFDPSGAAHASSSSEAVAAVAPATAAAVAPAGTAGLEVATQPLVAAGAVEVADAPALQQPQEQQPSRPVGATASNWWSSLLSRFSWVRFYAAMIATMQVLQQQHEQLSLQIAPVQQVCADR